MGGMKMTNHTATEARDLAIPHAEGYCSTEAQYEALEAHYSPSHWVEYPAIQRTEDGWELVDADAVEDSAAVVDELSAVIEAAEA